MSARRSRSALMVSRYPRPAPKPLRIRQVPCPVSQGKMLPPLNSGWVDDFRTTVATSRGRQDYG